MFAYCNNNPVVFSDPSGHMMCYDDRDLLGGDSSTNKVEQKKTMEEAVKDISNKSIYSRRVWKDSSVVVKEILLCIYFFEVSSAMELDGLRIEFFYESTSLRGRYSDKKRAIEINTRMLDDFHIYRTMRHELRHAYQYEAVRGMNTVTWTNKTTESYDILTAWFSNIQPGNYIPAGKRGYRKQPIEADAFSWAANTGPY